MCTVAACTAGIPLPGVASWSAGHVDNDSESLWFRIHPGKPFLKLSVERLSRGLGIRGEGCGLRGVGVPGVGLGQADRQEE